MSISESAGLKGKRRAVSARGPSYSILEASTRAGYTTFVIFAWDRRKAAANRTKHAVEFSEAATVFSDPLSWTFPDEGHSESEQRYLTIGESVRHRLLVVAHTEEDDSIRIISARLATARERKFYEES